MRTDKDRPSTWVPYKNGLCQRCRGECCTMPVEVKAADIARLGWVDEEQVRLAPKRVAKELIKQKKVISYRENSGFFMLAARPNGECALLDPKTRLCTVYEKRPDTCREFPLKGPRPDFCPYTPR